MTDARGLNNLGQVVGGNGSHALLYSGGVMTDLGTLGGLYSSAVAVNDSGQVVGWSQTPDAHAHVFRYSGGVMNDLGGRDGYFLRPTAINNNGDVVGWYPGTYGAAAVLYSNGGWTNILHPLFSYDSYAYGINSGGQIVVDVVAPSSGVEGAYVYTGAYGQNGGVPTATMGFGGITTHANAINYSGQVVGKAEIVRFSGVIHAFLYSGGVTTDLGTLGGASSEAYAINNIYTPGQNHGQIVGSSTTSSGVAHAFIYSGGTMTDLNSNPDLAVFRFEWDTTPGALMFIYTNSMIPGDTDLTAAIAINDEQQILCSNGILLTPRSQVAPLTAELYWANGAGIENKLSDTPFFTHTIPGSEFLRKNGASPPIQVLAGDMGNRPINATHVLLVLNTGSQPLEINTNNNVAALDITLPDLLPASLALNQNSGSVDFSYTVQPGTFGISSTTAKLFWANGTSIANKISNSAIFTQNIPAGFNGQSQIVSVPGSTFQSPPTNATHILLVVDPDNLITESTEGNNVAAVNINLPDLLATSIALNQNSQSVDFSYTVQPGTFGISSTTAKLFWANGTSITNKISNSAIFTQNIAAGFSGQSQIVSVPAANFQSPPTNATHVLLVVDPDNLITESSETNNVLALRTALETAPELTLTPGTNVTFCVKALGVPPLYYQWLFNGTNLVGQTQSCLTLPAVTSNQAGNYTVITSNSFGSITSVVTRLVVIGGVGISGGSGGSGGGNDLLLYLPVNGNAQDASGNGRHGVVSGATLTTNRFGDIASAYAFNGSSLITVTNLDPDDYATGFSFGGWVKPLGGGSPCYWVHDGDWGSTYILFSGNVYWRLGSGNSSTSYAFDPSGILSNGQWHHLFVTHDVNWNRLYVDGVKVAEAAALPLQGNVSTLQLGSGSFVGEIDEFVVFGRGLSSNEIAVIYNGTPTAPKILTQPQSRTIFPGTAATFTVNATGSTPLAYQWRKAGVNLNNETNAALTFSSGAAGDAGNYDVVVTNSYGSVTSIVATLTVMSSQGPAMDFAAPGGLYTDTSYSQGFEFDALQPITVTALGIFDDGMNGFAESHDVGIFSSSGTLLASTTVVSTNQLIGYFRYQQIPPVDLPAASGYRVAAVTGTERYTWSPSGTTTNALIRFVGDRYTPYTTNLVFPTRTDYRVGYFGANFLLTPSTSPPEITSQPQRTIVAAGQTAIFSVTATGTAPLGYQWRKSGLAMSDVGQISGSTTPVLTVTSAQLADAGSYTVVISNGYGSATSTVATLTVIVPVDSALQNATATASFLPYYPPSEAIDGITTGDQGWAIESGGSPATIVFETQTNIGFAEGSFLTFKLYQGTSLPGWPNYQLGRFRLSATTDDRSTFADGLENNGDVTANWTVLEPLSYSAANGATLTKQPDNSLLASGGANPTVDTIYTIAAFTALTNITGFRLEALTDPSLPSNGPGRRGNGSFVLQEFQVSIAPNQNSPSPPPVSWITIRTPAVSNSSVYLNFVGSTNSHWTVERATQVQGPWTNIGSFLTTSNGVGSFQDTNPPAVRSYYRAVRP